MIDAASRGALMDKTPAVARHLISNMASNTQQFGIKGAGQPWMENQLTELTSLVSVAARVCGICTSVEHPIDMCPTLQETESYHQESIGAIGGYQYGRYAAQRFGSALNVPQAQSGYQSSILNITIPTTATTENATSRQLTISRRPDEAISNKKFGVPAKHELQ
ncbi:hypothetical protein CR513_12981, partial [Mucuna pruriens]